MTVFARAIEAEDKAAALRMGCAAIADAGGKAFVIDPYSFAAIPGTPFAYWLPNQLRSLFAECESFGEAGRHLRQGLATADDGRFLRTWWEVDAGRHWAGFAKGGTFSAFYADVGLAVDWPTAGRQMLGSFSSSGRTRSNIWMLGGTINDYFGRPGLTWPRRTGRFSMRVLPAGAIFADKGPAVFVNSDEPSGLLSLLSLSTSVAFSYFVAAQLARTELAKSFEVGLIGSTPVPDLSPDAADVLASLARRGWSLRRSLDTVVEVSHAFVVPAVLQVDGGSFSERVRLWAERVVQVEGELDSVQAEIDEVCFQLYGISDEDRRAITEGFGVTDGVSGDSDEVDDGDEDAEVDPVGLGAGLVSWCVGVVAGRFDVRLATGVRGWPSEPDPFDPLPVCSPAMLTGEDGLPLVEPPAGYPVSVSPVLVDDPGHRLDLTSRVREVFDVVFDDDADQWWTDVGETLDARGGEVGSWLSKGFFDNHLKTHSKSRRKAPILWPIGTTSGSYQVWLYAHRVTGDSLFRVLNDLIVPKLNSEESKLVRLRQEAGPNPSASERKTIDSQERFVSELVELREMVEELAPLWAPDLNDGIVIVLAPLWRLFSHHKPWMRELKKHWGKLAAGEYDWAQLAMHLWPERVIPRCAEDRSLAIAHDLEEVFWQPDPQNDDKWIRRDIPTTPINQLAAARHKPTTKKALGIMGLA